MRTDCMRLSVLAVALTTLASGCWPVAPIAAITAGSSDSSSGGSLVGTNLDGSIIITSGPIAGLENDAGLDREPNNNVGHARTLGTLSSGRALMRGHSQVGATMHALGATATGTPRVLRRDFLRQADEESFPVRSTLRPSFLAQSPNALYLLDVQNGWRVQRLATAAGLPQREWTTPQQGTVVGFATLWDLLLVLKVSQTTPAETTLVALDPDSGTVQFEKSLGTGAFQGLAAGVDLKSGAPQLFTLERSSDTVHRINLLQGGLDTSITGTSAHFVTGLGANAGAMTFDGVFLHVVDHGRGAVHLFEADTGTLVSSLTGFAGAPGNGALTALAARLDLGLDAFHVRVPAGTALPVSLWTAARGSDGRQNRMFVMAVDRQKTVRDEPGAVLFMDVTDGGGQTRTTIPAHATTRDIDLVVGSLAGGSDYQVLVGLEFGSPDLKSDYRTADASVAAFLASQVQGALDSRRVHETYADPTLPEFVPGQVVMGIRGDDTGSPDVVSSFDLAEQRRSPAGYRVLDFQSQQPARLPTVQGVKTPAARNRADSAEVIDLICSLTDQPGVEWSEPVYVLRSLATTPNDGMWSRQRWQHDSMRLRNAWDITTGSNNVLIGIVDTGIRTENDDLAATLFDGYDFVADPFDGADGDGIDPDPYDDGGADSHGTHVAGSAAAIGNNSFGVSGVMWQGQVMPVRALGASGTGTSVDIAEGILYAARQANASWILPPRACDIINLSLGSALPANIIKGAVDLAVANGVLVMAATGNDGVKGVMYPAAYPSVVAVGASDILDQRATYSNYGGKIDFVAPGGDSGDVNLDGYPDMIYSTVGDPQGFRPGNFDYKIGTSMACGNAAGVAGLVRSVDSTSSITAVRTLLQSTCRDIAGAGFDNRTGYGTMDAYAAVSQAAPILNMNVTAADFGLNGTNLVVVAQNAGLGTLMVERLTKTPVVGTDSWLTATVLADGKSIALSADRSGLADGVYIVDLTVQTNGGTQTVNLTLTQTSTALPDVGAVIVELRDGDNNLVATSTTTLGEAYRYQLRNWRRGEYSLTCGVDVDQDGIICEAGEPCGMYPNKANAQDIDLAVNWISVDLLLE